MNPARLLLDLVLTGLASLGILWAETAIWREWLMDVTPSCGPQKIPDIPSALAVWAGMFATVLAVTTKNGAK
jgi:hypothetical protein